MNTGERIKKRRTELRITQDELADKNRIQIKSISSTS